MRRTCPHRQKTALASADQAGPEINGEIVAWDTDAGRLDFNGLQARMTAGRRLAAVAKRRPAQFVAFDVLAAGGADVRGRPLRERRRFLEAALSGLASPIVLCQQTDDESVATEWLDTLSAGGIEGVVVKDAVASYPTVDGQRVWCKRKALMTLDMVAIGFTGSAASVQALVLAFPGVVGDDGALLTAGSTTVMNRATARVVAPLLRRTGETFTRAFVWGNAEPSTVIVIEPLVVEVDADAAAEYGSLRHAARLVRVRADLDPADLETATP